METNTTPKKQGMIRTGAVVPTVVFILIVFLYFRFMFDSHLKKMIEWGGGYIYGAEIDVAGVETSFLKLSFGLNGLQVTDKTQPQRNIVSIGKMHFQMLGDALLRAKFVIDDASILDIGVYTPRKHIGFVKPPEPPSPKSTAPSAIDNIERKAANRLAGDYKNNVIGDIAKMLGGTSAKDQLKDIQMNLESSKKIDEIMAIIKKHQADGPKELADLPKKEDFDALAAKAKALKFDTKNPIQFAKDVKEANTLYGEADKMIKTVKEKTEAARKDIAALDNNIKTLDDSIKNDVANLKTHLNIPSFDPKKFSQSLFISLVNDKITGAEKYSATITEMMNSSPKKKTDPDLVPKSRSQGRNIRYPITKGYPLFWLKHASISSHANTSEFSGDVTGTLENITTSPQVTQKLMTAEFTGNFPKQEVSGLKALIKIDAFKEMKKTFSFDVASYPFPGMKFVDSSDVKMNLVKSMASLNMGGEIDGENHFHMALQNVFKTNTFEIDAKQELVKKILTNVVNGIKEISLNASIGGSFDNLDIDMNSNLGGELADGFKREIANQFSGQTKAIEEMVQNKIKPQKDQLNGEMGKFKTQYLSQFQQKEKDMQGVADQTKSQLNNKGGGAGGGGKSNSPKDLLNGLKKGFHF
jgi:uncharacterized protein (TIGR03545 family)